MGVNIFVLVRSIPTLSTGNDDEFHAFEIIEKLPVDTEGPEITPDETAEDTTNVTDAVCDAFNVQGLCDWADVYKGTDAKPLMTIPEALSFGDADGPWYVVESSLVDGEILIHRCVDKDGKINATFWRQILKSKPDYYKVLFLKGRN